MSYTDYEIQEMKGYCSTLQRCEEGGVTFFLLEGMTLPEGCRPQVVDALLCPTARDGYPSRLYLSERVQAPRATPNWTVNGARLCERNWHAYSWNVSRSGLRLAQILVGHLKALV